MKLTASQVYTVMEFARSCSNATMFTTYAVYQVITLGLTPLQLLLVGMVLEGTVLLFEGITGVFADTYGRRLSVLAGMFILSAGFVLEGSAVWLGAAFPLMEAFLWLLLAQVIFGVGATFISGADTAWIVDEVGEERAGALFLRAGRTAVAGNLTGIGLSVGLSQLGTNLPYIAGGIMYLLLGGFLYVFMKETRFVPPAREGAAPSHWRRMVGTWHDGAQAVRQRPILWMILLAAVFGGAASEGYDRLWQAHLIVDIGYPQGGFMTTAAWIGLIALLSALLSVPVMRLAEKRLDLSRERTVFVGVIVLTAVRASAIAALALAPGFAWAFAAVLVLEAVRTLYGPLYETWVNLNIGSKARATVLSMMGQSDALGQTAGGPFVGWIGSRWSIRAALMAAAVLYAAVLGVFGRVRRQE